MTTIKQLSNAYLWNSLITSSSAANKSSFNSQQSQLNSNLQSWQAMSKLTAQKFQTQQTQYRDTVSSFTKSVKNVGNSVKPLTSNTLFDQKYVSTSTGTAISGQAQSGATSSQYTIGVSQLAAAQRNEGKTLAASAYGGVATGTSTLGIQVGSSAERQISVNVLATDTNKDVLNKFASAVNSSGAGVKAEVITKNSSQYLSITSKNTGAATSFAIRDISNNAVATLQLDNKVTTAADANYTVNGTNYQSSSNKVSIDANKVSLNLNATTTGNIKVNVGKDNTKIVDAAKNLITNYNNLHNVLNNSDNTTTRGDIVLNSVESLVGKTRIDDFANIGISVDKSTGDLSLDESKLSDALASTPDKVKSLLAGGGGLGKTIERVSKEITTTPASSYLQPPALNYSSQFNYSSFASQQDSFTQGLFLNMFA